MVPIFRMGSLRQAVQVTYQTTLQLQNEGIVAVSADWSGSTDYAASEAELDIVVNGPNRCWYSRDCC